MSLMGLTGIPIIEDSRLIVPRQYRRTWHKKWRIFKKWRNDPRNWTVVPDPAAYIMKSPLGIPTRIVCHPATAAAVRRSLERETGGNHGH